MTEIKRRVPVDDLSSILQGFESRLSRLEAPGVAYGEGPPVDIPDAPTIYIDTLNDKLYAYTTAWKSVTVA